LDFRLLELPAGSPLVVTDGTAWMGIFGQALAIARGLVALVLIFEGFRPPDVPAGPPVLVTDGTAWIGIFGQAQAIDGGQIAFVLLSIMVEQRHLDLSIPRTLIHTI
jgi:hypothetical protein